MTFRSSAIRADVRASTRPSISTMSAATMTSAKPTIELATPPAVMITFFGAMTSSVQCRDQQDRGDETDRVDHTISRQR
jgi:hypothetical protein